MPQGSTQSAPFAKPADAWALTYGSFGERKLSRLCQGLGVSPRLGKEFLRVFRVLSASWASLPLGPAPIWPTDVTDDGSPFEFSVAFDGARPKIRLLVESLEEPMTLVSSWKAGHRLTERLSQSQGVDLDRFERVCDLFEPGRDAPARFALWHGALLEEWLPTAYKVYLNPQVHGSPSARSVVLKALARLDMGRAADFVASRSASNADDPFLYFALDLWSDPSARVKLYVAHPGADAGAIERAIAGTRNHVPGAARSWIHRLLGGGGPFQDRPILTCYAFTSADDLPVATVHLPIRCYAGSDEDCVDRAFEHLGLRDRQSLRSAAELFADRALDAGRGLVTYVSLRPSKQGPAVTVYLAPEAFAVMPPRVPGPSRKR